MKKSLHILFLLIIVLYFIAYPQSQNNFYSVRDSVSAYRISDHLGFLASDLLQGRAVGSMGEKLSSDYIAKIFDKNGLLKNPMNNTYFQNIPMHGSFTLPGSSLILITEDDTTELEYSEDYFLYRSGQQTFIPTPLPIVFVGYGIIAPEFDYNDYQSVDVTGKIVVYVDGEPYSDNDEYFDGPTPTIYSFAESKRRIALSRGAAGTIQIPVEQFVDWEVVVKDFSSEDVTLAYSVSGNLSLIINPNTAAKLFSNSSYTFNDILKMHSENRMKSFLLRSQIKFEGQFKERDFISQNVIGIITGSDAELKNEYVLISAHYDHIGIGMPLNGDSIYNGALDNAIGVSVMLELSRAFSELNIKPKRSLIFIATTGEEKGLLGSTYYIDNPVVPLYKTIANLNIDGIAMFKDFIGLVPIGAQYSTLVNTLFQIAEEYGLEIEDIPSQFRSFDAFNKSDQLAFAIGGIPSILILEGLSNKTKSKDQVIQSFIDYYLNIYHSPFDDLSQNIDTEAAAKHAKILFEYCYRLANDINVPEWNSGSPFINARLRSIAEKR